MGPPITLQPPMSISVPSQANASFQITAQSIFVSSIGATTCGGGRLVYISAATTPVPLKTEQVAETVSITVTAIATVTPTSLVPKALQTNGSTQSVVGPATDMGAGERAAIGVAVPAIVIVLLTAGLDSGFADIDRLEQIFIDLIIKSLNTVRDRKCKRTRSKTKYTVMK